ncbi:MAG: rRNA maturation RNase YbeY [Bacteroidota bacterium]|jgi:rRNA maturation RNase YbeY
MVHFFTADVPYVVRDKGNIRDWLQQTAGKEKASIESLNIILCSDGFLYRMNVEYLGHHTLTDIITFDYSISRKRLNGEMYISIDRVRENAKELNNSVKDELHRVFVHGLLHLCGYSDKSPSKKAEMRNREDRALASRGF